MELAGTLCTSSKQIHLVSIQASNQLVVCVCVSGVPAFLPGSVGVPGSGVVNISGADKPTHSFQPEREHALPYLSQAPCAYTKQPRIIYCAAAGSSVTFLSNDNYRKCRKLQQGAGFNLVDYKIAKYVT